MKSIRILGKLLLVLLLLLACSTYSYAATAAGYSEYYVPGSEDSMSLALRSFGPTPTNNTHALITITAWSDNVTVYYDHWENGINFDPDNPAATADETFTLATTGTLLTLDNTPVGGIPIPRNSSNTYYDGGDRIYVAGGAVTVARVSWLEARGRAIQAVAWEIYPVKPQLTTYVLPFGEDLSASFTDFLGTYVVVQATADNTTFTVDLDGDGTPDPLDQNFDGDTLDPGDTTVVTLQAGESFFLGNVPVNPVPMPPGARATMNSGAIIQGSSTLQVKFIVGDPAANYETRGLSAFPRGYWTREYYAPVGEPANGTITDIFLYNPHASAITVNWETLAGSGSFTINAGSTVSYRAAAGALPVGGGVYLRGSDVFWGVSTVDSTGQVNEWAYSLLPTTLLYDEHFLGWAPGGADGNDSGVFLTVVQDNTRVFVDTNNDGTADQTYTLNRLQSQYITDPTDGDLSGTRFWATGQFSMAYGQNPDTAPAQATSGDLGYVAIPGTDFISLVLTVDKAVSPQVVPTAFGSTATYTLTVNSQKYTVDGIAVTDYLPANWAFVNNSAVITLPDLTQISGAAANPAITGTGPYMLDWPGSLLGNMAENQEIIITFSAQTTAALATGTLSENRVKAVGTRTFGTPSQTQTFTTTDFVYVATGNTLALPVEQITKTSSATDPLSPGNQFTYTVTVSNPAAATTNLTGVSIYDPLPAGVSYVAGSGSVTCNIPRNVRDVFGAVAYNNTNGSVSWAANPWAETDPGPGVAGAAGGFLWITAGQLQFRYVLANVADDFSTNASYSDNDGSNNWNAAWTETGDDAAAGSGSIQVTGGYARFRQGTANRSISRTATVTGATSATIDFDVTDNGMDAGETMVAEYSIDGGGYVTIGTLDGAAGWTWGAGGAVPLTIALAGNNTLAIRFRAPQAWNNATNDEARVDNVNISFNAPANAIGTQIKRTANLTGATNAVLNFDYNSAGLAAGDILVVEASNNAVGPFTVLGTFTAGVPNVAPSYDLTPYISGATTIQFRVTGGFNAAGKAFNVDNVDISYIVPPPTTFTSGNPPDFLASSTGCAIAPGGFLTLTYNVTVDDPFPTGQTSITNTASTTSAQLPIAITASVTNTVLVPSSLSASAGGRVWLDADGDGVQDIGEPGMPNIEVTLKDLFGTPVAMTLTDGSGRYLFTGVTPGTDYYVEVTDGLPTGLSQTFPLPPGLNRTASFNLADGQVYTTADLGYRASAGTASFGDLVWVDADADNIRDAGEIGLGGVTVTLYRDANGNGQLDFGTDTLVGTTTSGPDGTYLFTGVPATGAETYFVSVSTPSGYVSTSGSTIYRFINVAAGNTFLTADFGFNSTTTTYSIKDRVWTDTDGGQDFDVGVENGIAGVTIELLDASLNVIGTTSTASDGSFTFSGLAGGGADYTVRINDTGGVLLDYYGTTSYSLALERAESNLAASIDRVATPPPSYGFRPLRSIGDTIFSDLGGANGVQDAGEGGIAGVVVSLYRNNAPLGTFDGGDTLISTVTADANGQYLFSGLADGEYIISVPVPAGYNFIPNGAVNPDLDGNPANGIQNRATMSGGVNVLDKDFGFRVPASRTVSGTIWDDLDADGVIDGGEALLANVTTEIRRNCPAPCTLVSTVTTNASGVYSVAGLVNDNTYTVFVTDTNSVLTGYDPTFEYGVGTAGPFDNQAPVDLTSGDVGNVNFGFKNPTPTLAILSNFRIYKEDGRVRVEWTTSSEIDTAGFFLFRLEETTGKYRQINRSLLPALLGSHQGGIYSVIDNGASLEKGNTYVLVEIEGKGAKNAYGPFTVKAGTARAGGYSSSAKAAGAFLSNFDRPAELQTKKITRYVDREGTIVITNNSKPARGAGDSVADEISDYKRTLKAVTAGQTMRLSLRKEAMAQGSSLKKQRPGGMVKIAIEKDGLYYISSAEISRLKGISQNEVKQLLTTDKLAINNQGNEVAYLPSEDYSGIYFYGQGTDSIYTKENIYWLYKGIGTRMGYTTDAGPAPVEGMTFPDTVHAEENSFLAAYPFMDPEADFWFWDQIVGGFPGYDTKTFTIETKGAAGTPSTATLTTNLQGFTETPADPDHHVQVSVNGTVIGNDWWNGTEKRFSRFEFSQSLLNSGPNTIQVKGLLDTGAPWSLFYINSFDLSYQRLYEAEDNSLLLRGGANPTVTVQGFTDSDILVFDVTNPLGPVLKTATTVEPYADKYRVSFVPSSPESIYLAIAASAAPEITGAWADSPSQLSNTGNQADYILIAPDELIAGAQELADYRQGRGLKTMVVNVEDVMDEFNYGLSSPKGIQAFLTYAYNNWSKPPQYVVLIGDGTYDYRDNLHYREGLIPTMVVKTPDGLFTSDNILADVNGDHVPEMAIGRLPVLSAEELHNATAKIVAYERNIGNRLLMLADNADEGGNFPADSDALAALITGKYQVKKLYLSGYNIIDARQILFSEISSGTSLINYLGHASSDNLAAENLLGLSDVNALSNSARPFVLNAMTCMTGQYAYPGADSLSETLLLKKDGGAATVWAPSGLAFNSDSKLLAGYFFRTAQAKRGVILGSAILDSFRSFYNQGGPSYVLDTYTLQGDPALKLW